jgi:uncharacterized protein YciI
MEDYYVVLLRKGPRWTGDETPELEALQARHIEHIGHMRAIGKLAMSGPVDAWADSDIRGVLIFWPAQFASMDEVRALVEADPKIRVDHLKPEYLTWRVPEAQALASQKAEGEG